MHRIRAIMMWLIPYYVWTMFFYLGYIIVSNIIKIGNVEVSIYGMASSYLNGFMVILPLVIFKELEKRLKYFLVFLVVGVVTTLGIVWLSNNYLLVALSVLIWILYVKKRTSKEICFLDEVHPMLLLVYPVYFLLTATQGYETIQKVTFCSLLITCVLIFVWYGIVRFQTYITIRKDKAHMPVDKIQKTGTSIYISLLVLLVVVFTPLMMYQYDFVEVYFDYYERDFEITEESAETQDQEGASYSFNDLVGETKTSYVLVVLWNVIEKIMCVVVAILLVVFAIKIIRSLLYNFQKMEVDKQDVITSTLVLDREVKKQQRKIKVEEFFDFSYEMRVRRKYRKELNKYQPKNWQSPSEMEVMAGLDIPELHDEYERIRYGK